jgi:hypothetical protein
MTPSEGKETLKGGLNHWCRHKHVTSTVLVTALGSWEKTVPRGKPIITLRCKCDAVHSST